MVSLVINLYLAQIIPLWDRKRAYCRELTRLRLDCLGSYHGTYTMRKVFGISRAIVLALLVFSALMYAFVFTIFRFSGGYVRSDVFSTVASVLFICSALLTNMAWKSMCARFLRDNSK